MIDTKKAQTKLNIIPEIGLRWSPRAFGEKPLTDDVLKRIFEAGRWAPSSRNEQPWRFIVARKEDEHYNKVFSALDEFNQKWAWTAPVLVVVLGMKKHAYKGRSNAYHMHDVGLAVGNILAQATHEGAAVHQMGGINPSAVIESFNIDPEELQVVSIMAIGFQNESRLKELDDQYHDSEYKVRDRKGLSELVFGSSLSENPSWLKS